MNNKIILCLCMGLFLSTSQAQDGFNKSELQFENLKYIVSVPEGYTKENTHPTIIFLHGADGSNTKHHPMKYAMKASIHFPFIVIAPSCNSGCSWSSVDLKGLLDQASSKYSIDRNRVFLIGYSMGGAGTWANLKKMPDILAAAVPMAPAGGTTTGLCEVSNVSVRVYHGTADYGYDRSVKMVEALKSCGAKHAELVSLKGQGHGIWPGILSDASIYEWLLKHTKRP